MLPVLQKRADELERFPVSLRGETSNGPRITLVIYCDERWHNITSLTGYLSAMYWFGASAVAVPAPLLGLALGIVGAFFAGLSVYADDMSAGC